VPLDLANTDYQNLMALVAAGELTIAPAEQENANG
jgi:exonuclease VII small subunit